MLDCKTDIMYFLQGRQGLSSVIRRGRDLMSPDYSLPCSGLLLYLSYFFKSTSTQIVFLLLLFLQVHTGSDFMTVLVPVSLQSKASIMGT